jgi:hypothetical protein
VTGDVELPSVPRLWVEAFSMPTTETHATAQKTIHRQGLVICDSPKASTDTVQNSEGTVMSEFH